MLELRLDTATNIYAAPMQMKANNGLLVIDDFGRQAISPRQLLNRWIIPLDRKVDYLTLRHGKKFPIPFELMVVFATNLDPRELTDEAFFRRIHNKIYVPPCEPEVFDAIFHRLAQQQGLRYAPDAPAYLRKLCQEAGSSELRACHPADILSILGWISRYKHQPIDVSKTAMERAAGLYFAQDRESRKLGEQD